jgi:hypothetical protein
MREFLVPLQGAVITALMVSVLSAPAANAQGVLLPGQLAEGTILVADDSDSWTFSAGTGDAIIVRMGKLVSGSSLSPRLQIFDPIGTLLETDLGADPEVSVTAGITGTYVAVASEAPGGVMGTGSYRISLARSGSSVTVSPGDEGGPAANGAMHIGTVLVGDLDLWTVSAAAGDAIVVRMGEIVGGSSLAPHLRVYDPAGTLLGTSQHPSDVELSVTAGIAGTYLVVASDDFGNVTGSGDYRITLARSGTAATVSPGDEGGPLSHGGVHTGTVLVGDLDVWTVSALAGESIVVRMGETVIGSSLTPFLRIFDPAGTVMEDKDTEEAEVAVTAGIAGTYLVVASDDVRNLTGSGDYWITRLGTSAVETAPPTVEFRLAPATPNPFVARTTLAYHLPERGPALLRLFDPQGRLVRTLLDEAAMPAGAHEVAWDGRDMAGREMVPGLYFACLEAGGRRTAQKVLLAR